MTTMPFYQKSKSDNKLTIVCLKINTSWPRGRFGVSLPKVYGFNFHGLKYQTRSCAVDIITSVKCILGILHHVVSPPKVSHMVSAKYQVVSTCHPPNIRGWGMIPLACSINSIMKSHDVWSCLPPRDSIEEPILHTYTALRGLWMPPSLPGCL